VIRWLLVSWAANAVVLGITAWIFSGVSVNGSGWTLLWAALVFGLLNTGLKPLLKFATFPLALVTLGVAWFFVSMLMLWLTDAIVPAFDVSGFWSYVGATIVVWAINAVLDGVFRRDDRRRAPAHA
jgi:putative membrane protein